MEKVSYTMEVPKEGKEVVDSLASIAEHFVNGGSVTDAAKLLPGVMVAVDNISAIGEEIKSDGKDELAGYTVHKIWGALEKKEA